MKKLHKDQSGAAMVLVIVSIAFVSLLAIVILTITMSNLRMKMIDQKAKDNFYSAEIALDEIKTGLQKDVSTQMTKAYLNVAENYGSWKEMSETNPDVLKRMRETFVTDYITGLRKELRQGTSDNAYSPDKLESYLVKAKDAVLSSNDEENSYRLMTTENGILLKDLKVTYTDNMAYTSIITTDIFIGIPDMEFSVTDSMPSFLDFALVADDKLDLGVGSTLRVSGSLYGGNTGVNIESSASLDVTGADLVITDSDIDFGLNSSYTGSDRTTSWMHGMVLYDNTRINLGGRTYVKDDLTVNGRDSSVSMGTEYYGYGDAEDNASDSSAIVVNGRGTTLNMSTLNTLMLAGNSFVTTSQGSQQASGTNTRTGSSISVKSDQLAYLVPDECEGLTSNPMSASQFTTLTSDGDWKNKILDSTLDGLNRTLRDFGADIVEYHVSINGQAQVYLYANFSNVDTAAEYFSEYYGDSLNHDQMNRFLNLFVTSISSPNDYTRLDVAGNYLVREEDGSAEIRRAGVSADNGERAQEITTYNNMFEAYTKILSSNYETFSEAQKTRSAFENLMSRDSASGEYKLTEYMQDKGVSSGTAQILEGSDGVQAILVDNAGRGAYDVDIRNGKGILIITGDAIIRNLNFSGLVLVGRQVQVADGAEVVLRGDSDSVAYALMISDEIESIVQGGSKTWRIMDFFNVSDWRFLDGTGAGDSEDEEDKKLSPEELVVYQNWKKE